jgi:hypothetical protein
VIDGTYYTLHDEVYCEQHYKEQVIREKRSEVRISRG